jgi:predicted DNA-binding transcriptional regulator YafY
MQIERQWRLLKLIPNRVDRRSTEEIWNSLRQEKEFEDISKRTVERDLASLESFFPLRQSTEGRTNYWYWADGVSMWLPGLTDDEALAFHMVERNLRQLLPEGIIERLGSYFKVANAKLAERAGNIRPQTQKFRLIASGVPRVARKILNAKASGKVRHALLKDQQIHITYWGKGPEGIIEKDDGTIDVVTLDAVINPLAIVQRDNELFLVFSKRGSHEPQFMALRDIESATPSLARFDGPENFDIDAYIKSGALHFEHDLPIRIGDWIQLSASFTKEARDRLYNTPLVASEHISRDRDGRTRFLMPLRFTADLADWLLSLGPKVRVHQPAALRRWLAAKLAEAADQYRGENIAEEAQHTFRWYEKWDAVELKCEHCNWSGQADAKELEPNDSGDPTDCEFRCPQCNKLLMIVDYIATIDDLVKNWDIIDPGTRSAVLTTPERMDQFEQEKLKSPDQLPDLKNSVGFLTWNLVRHERGEISNVIRHGSHVIWVQPALWDGADEFVRVTAILAQRYAGRIRDIRISPEARAYLSPNRVAEHQKVEGARLQLRHSTQ